MTTDVLVIGAGLAGLAAGWQSAASGRSTRVIAKGWGATHWHSGCLDVLGYYPLDSQATVKSPESAVARLIEENPRHPYALAGQANLDEALCAFQDLCARSGYPLPGSLESNWLLPSAVGALRPTCLAPETMIAGDLRQHEPMLIVGFEAFQDFYPGLIADNLNTQGVLARNVSLDLPSLRQRRSVNAIILARLFETPDFRAEVADALKPRLGDAARVGFPAVLGLHDALQVKRDLEERLGRRIFEVPTLPPSVPGMRLHQVLIEAIEAAGGGVFDGMEALSADADAAQKRITAVWTEAAARQRPHRAAMYVLATGGILGGGITADQDGQVREVVFDLPVAAPGDRSEWFHREFLDPRGHPIHRGGLSVNHSFQPVDGDEHVVYENLWVAGTTLAHCEVLRERSLEGVALVTGYLAGRLAGTR